MNECTHGIVNRHVIDIDIPQDTFTICPGLPLNKTVTVVDAIQERREWYEENKRRSEEDACNYTISKHTLMRSRYLDYKSIIDKTHPDESLWAREDWQRHAQWWLDQNEKWIKMFESGAFYPCIPYLEKEKDA